MDECPQPHDSNEAVYRIKIQGRLDKRWRDWFNGMNMTTEGDFTLLAGVIADQSKLRGILSKVWDLNLIVVSVNRIEQIEDSSNKNEEADNG